MSTYRRPKIILSNAVRKARLFSLKIANFFQSPPVWPFLIFIFWTALFMRVVFPIGLGYWDDFDYSRIAKTIEEGRFFPQNYNTWFAHRYTILYPVALSLRLFGNNEFALLLWPFVASMGSVFFTYGIGSRLFSKNAGLFAALLMALHPLEARFGSTLLPAPIFTFVLSGSVYFWILGERLKPAHVRGVFRFFLKNPVDYSASPTAQSRRWKQPLWILCWLLSSLLLSSTIYIRPYGLLLLGVPAMYMLLRYRVRWEYAWLPLFTLGWFLLMEWYLRQLTGEWFFTQKFLGWFMDKDMYPIGNVTEHLGFYARLLVDNPYYYGSFFLCLLALPVYWRSQEGRYEKWVPVLWLLLLFGYLEFGVFSLKHLSFLFKEDRYLGVIDPAIALIAGQAMAAKLPRHALWLIFVSLLIAALYFAQASDMLEHLPQLPPFR